MADVTSDRESGCSLEIGGKSQLVRAGIPAWLTLTTIDQMKEMLLKRLGSVFRSKAVVIVVVVVAVVFHGANAS